MSFEWAIKQINDLRKNTPEKENFDPDYLHLRNPYYENLIEDIFFDKFLPKIESAFDNRQFEIHKNNDYPSLDNKFCTKLCKKFVFLIEDPERPFQIGCLNKSWFTRFKLEIFKAHYMFGIELFLYLPEEYDINKIMTLLKNDFFEGNRPDLSVDNDIYSIKFTQGKGAGWGLESYDEASENIYKKLRQIQNILTFLNNNENQLNSEEKFNTLENLLINSFESY